MRSRVKAARELARQLAKGGHQSWADIGQAIADLLTGEATSEVVATVAADLRTAWRESGACATYSRRATFNDKADDSTACNGCGIAEVPHRLLQFAERLERNAKGTS